MKLPAGIILLNIATYSNTVYMIKRIYKTLLTVQYILDYWKHDIHAMFIIFNRVYFAYGQIVYIYFKIIHQRNMLLQWSLLRYDDKKMFFFFICLKFSDIAYPTVKYTAIQCTLSSDLRKDTLAWIEWITRHLQELLKMCL